MALNGHSRVKYKYFMKKVERSLFVKNIIRRRKNLGWTQETLATKAHVALGTLKNIERGKSEGWPGTREAIARALDCSVEELHMPDHPKPEQISELLLKEMKRLRSALAVQNIDNPEMAEALDLLASLEADKFAIAVELIRSLTRSNSASKARLRK